MGFTRLERVSLRGQPSDEALRPVPGKFDFTYRDSTGRQRWQTAKGDTKADAKAERAEMVVRLHRGERVVRRQVLASADPARRPLGERCAEGVDVAEIRGGRA